MHLECASWSSGHNLAHRAAVRESFAQYYKPKALHTPSMETMYRPIRINPFCLKMKSVDYVSERIHFRDKKYL